MPFDFPSSPTDGQIFNAPSGPTYVFNTPAWRAVGQGQIAIISDAAPASPANGQLWLESDTGLLFCYWNDGNSSQWVQVGGNAATGSLPTQQVFTSSGTWNKPANCIAIMVEGCGGGGGGGGCTGAAGTYVAGAGGGSGASGRINLGNGSAVLDVTATTSIAVTIGAAGTVVSGSVGNSGGSTSIPGYSWGGGGGGNGAAGNASGQVLNGGPGGVGTNVFGGGAAGANGIAMATFCMAGAGGSSVYGRGGGPTRLAGAGSTVGLAGAGYGGGGGGAVVSATAINVAGGVGLDGIIIVTEYYR